MKHISTKTSHLFAAILLSSVAVAALATPPGRMTGGGSIYCPAPAYRVTFGYELHCRPHGGALQGPNNLEVNFSSGEHFHLTSLTVSDCSGPSATTPPAPFNTLYGEGSGTFNGEPATIMFEVVDNAEPGAGQDTAGFVINTGAGTALACGPLVLEGGNNQAHTATGRRAR